MRNPTKIICHSFMLTIVLTLISCNSSVASPTVSMSPIKLEVRLDEESYCINENINVQVFLTNTSNNNVLIDGRWVLLPVLMPPGMSSGALFLVDSSGKKITSTVDIERMGVREDDFIVLEPGQTITKSVAIHDRQYGDPNNYFRYALRESEMYTIVALYQNTLEFSRTINGKQITAWSGEITGTQKFQVKSKDCLNQ